MNLRGLSLLAALSLALSACPAPAPPVVPVDDPDGGDYPGPPDWTVQELAEDSPQGLSSPCGKACENLRRLPCREGFPTAAGISCYRGCLSMAKQQRLPTRCWTLSRSPADARACGSLRCL